MKLRVISAITLVVIVIMTSVGVFIEKLDTNPGHQRTDIGATITNIVSNPQILYPKERFSINGTIYNPNPYTINFDTDSISAKFDKNVITVHYPSCSNVVEGGVIRPHQSVGFTLPHGCEAYFANSTGMTNATIVITYVAGRSVSTVTTSKNFTISQSLENHTGLTLEEQLGLSNTKINPPGETSIFDTGIHPFFINVTNTNFTLNYNISGNNKLLDANMDSPSKSLVLSLNTTNNGTLIVSLPRGMIDAKLPTGNDDKFYVLVNGQESVFKEINTTTIDRTISIPFTNGTHVIEIIGAQII